MGPYPTLEALGLNGFFFGESSYEDSSSLSLLDSLFSTVAFLLVFFFFFFFSVALLALLTA